jgi:DNA/RNA-binding domain of Phe-tRNA-synthetase-like protein
MAESFKFEIADEVRDLGLRGAYFLLRDLSPSSSDAGAREFVERTCSDATGALTDEDLDTDPVLVGFRELHDRVGRGGKKNVASPEALLRLIVQGGTLPAVNPVVDVYNAISIKSRLALGAHDAAEISGDVHLRLTRGDERFVPLGRDKPRGVGPGEYAYIDDDNDIICRMETRQVEKTKISEETRDCFYIVQGNARTSPSLVRETMDELIAVTTRLCGGTAEILAFVE